MLIVLGAISFLGTFTDLKDLSTNVLASVLLLLIGILFLDDLIEAARKSRFAAYEGFLRRRLRLVLGDWAEIVGNVAELHNEQVPEPRVPDGLSWIVGHQAFILCGDVGHLQTARRVAVEVREELAHFQQRWFGFAPPEAVERLAEYEELVLQFCDWLAGVISCAAAAQTDPAHTVHLVAEASALNERARRGAQLCLDIDRLVREEGSP